MKHQIPLQAAEIEDTLYRNEAPDRVSPVILNADIRRSVCTKAHQSFTSK